MHEAKHGQQAQGIKRQWIPEVDAHGMGTITLENGPQALGQEGHRLVPGDALIPAIGAPAQGK